jgi:protein TonB
MNKCLTYFMLGGVAVLWLAAPLRAEFSAAEEEAFRTRYLNKVWVFRTNYRMVSRLEINADGTVAGNHKPGYWAMDGACQVKSVAFQKERVAVQCTKLWANIMDDGKLHYFPATIALKGRGGYPDKVELVFKTEGGSVAQLIQAVEKVFYSDQESVMPAVPAPIAAYIHKRAVVPDIDPVTGQGFKGTPPKPRSTPGPALSKEADIVGQAGEEKFVILVDEQGKPSVEGFTHLLQYGLEEATIEAVRNWKYEPAMLDGKAVPLRIETQIDYRRGAK